MSGTGKADLQAFIRKGTLKSREITRARLLSLLGVEKGRQTIESELGVSAGQY